MVMARGFNRAADLVIRNAHIHTVNLSIDEIRAGRTDFTTIERGFVAILHGKTVAVSDGDPTEWIGEKTQVINAAGKTLMPGLIDAHIHAQFAGEGLLCIDMRDVTSLAETQRLIAEKAETTPAGKFIQGKYWNELLWDKPVLPLRSDLDAVSPEHPVFLMRTCYHVACANSMALKLAGITKDTLDPPGGEIGRDENGEPNGLLYENSAMRLVQTKIPALTEDEQLHAISQIGAYLNRFGITSVIDANLSFAQMRAYDQAYKRGMLSYRARFMFYLDSADGDTAYHLRRLDEMPVVTGFGNDMLKLNGIKITLDGIPAAGTAYMRNPYRHMPETRGYSTIMPEELNAFVLKGASYHWQTGVHAIGDSAVDLTLDAYDKADQAYGPISDDRYYIIHMPFPHPEQISAMQRLNVGLATQPAIFHTMGEESILFPEQMEINNAVKPFADQGVIVAGSSDHPVSSCNPFLGMYAAVTRKTSSGEVWGAQHAVSPRYALLMWTKNAAYLSHDDDKQGSLAPGYFADMILTDQDVLNCPHEKIKDVKVLLTVLNGKIVYKAE
jgi:predicted amidohydrolase YtcJ